MAARSVACTLINQTGEPLTLEGPPQLDHGILTPGQAPPPSCDGSASWSAESEGFMTGTEGRLTYRGPSGKVTVFWNNPFVGGNDYNMTLTGDYVLVKVQGPKVGSNVSATYVVDRKNKPAPAPPPEPPKPAEESAPPPAAPVRQWAERPEEIGRDSHVPKVGRTVTIISPKDWLVDIAWQAVNELEWSPLVLEITENRHGTYKGGECPKNLLAIPGVRSSGICRRNHDEKKQKALARDAQYEAELKRLKAGGMDPEAAKKQALKSHPPLTEEFYSWCGDFVSWVFWKAWMLRGMPEDKVTKSELGKFLNREALNGQWLPGENLNMVEAYAKGIPFDQLGKRFGARGTPSGLLVWHDPGDGYVPQPGDIFMANRHSGGHISILASYDVQESFEPSERERKRPFHWFLTVDGKSWDYSADRGTPDENIDKGWALSVPKGQSMPPEAQGVAQNRRKTNAKKDPLKGFIDTSKLREALGYR